MCARKIGRPGWFGDVIGHSLRCGCVSLPTYPCNECGHMTNCMGDMQLRPKLHRLHHQIDQAFPIFLTTLKNVVRGYIVHTHTQMHEKLLSSWNLNPGHSVASWILLHVHIHTVVYRRWLMLCQCLSLRWPCRTQKMKHGCSFSKM